LTRAVAPGARQAGSLLLAALLVSGCAGAPIDRTELMPAPAVFADGRFDPFSGVPDQGRRIENAILYATDRDPAGPGDPEPHYTNRRGNLVRLGRAQVLHGDGTLDWNTATQLSLQQDRKPPYRLRLSAVEELGILGRSVSPFTDPKLLPADPGAAGADFAAAVNARLARSDNRDVIIYVHGFKVPFENPLLIATELWHFMGYDGVVIPYSWPATPRLLAYFSDVETTALSAHLLKEFIQFLRTDTDAQRVHILGFSAGTRVVLDALSMLAMSGNPGADGARIGEVILVGSDVDTGLFAAALANGVLQTSERLTVYISGIDGALRFANMVFGRERLGQLLDLDMPEHVAATLNAADNLVLIDVTDAEDAGARSGHSYFRDSPWVSSDILATLSTRLGPAERGLVRAQPSRPLWRYPPDFIARLQRGLIRAADGQ
jgi:esterase/lipase superfamily enzyme